MIIGIGFVGVILGIKPFLKFNGDDLPLIVQVVILCPAWRQGQKKGGHAEHGDSSGPGEASFVFGSA